MTKKTNILDVGHRDACHLAPGATLSAKAQQAQTLRGKGQAIEVMPDQDFVQALEK